MTLALRRLLSCVAAVALTSVASTAFAEPDAGTADDATATVADAGSTSDAVATPADVTAADAPAPADTAADTATDTGPDAVSTPDAVSQTDVAPTDTGPTSFNENPCWDAKCVKETNACKNDKVCSAFVACKGVAECIQKIVTTKAIDDALKAVMKPLEACGWKACADPNAGTCKGNCGKYLGATAKCNCDDACVQYNDCCADLKEVCGDNEASCANACGGKGKFKDGKEGACYCDDECDGSGDCCKDKAQFCPSGGGGDTSTTTDAGTCAPNCAGKLCGDDDGCGGQCGGKCANATDFCTTDPATKKKACKAIGGGGADTANAGDTSTGGGADSVAAGLADSGPDSAKAEAAGTTGTTGTSNSSGSTSSSSGCTSGSSSGNASWLVSLLALVGALALRRRFA
ncbi:MAG: hypothetical protein EXR77_10800 [Myxococcales bacterium]|nr:hypothetical protein [Myxococcales bacterium]